MARLDTLHPGYGQRNAGYGTAEHRAGLARLGDAHPPQLSADSAFAAATTTG